MPRAAAKLKGIVVRQPYVDWILDGRKTWEIRGSATTIRGPVALIQGGSGTIVGTCRLKDVIGPLRRKDLQRNAGKLNCKASELAGPRYYGDHTYAWVLSNVRRLLNPVSYRNPAGAVIWVNLR